MDDLISRQAAIDAIGEMSDNIYKTKQKGATYPHDDFFQGMAHAENIVKHLPSAQPEPAQWVQMLINPRMYRCSNCNIAWNKRLVFDLDNHNEMFMKYCPCCGKKMLAEVDYE